MSRHRFPGNNKSRRKGPTTRRRADPYGDEDAPRGGFFKAFLLPLCIFVVIAGFGIWKVLGGAAQ